MSMQENSSLRTGESLAAEGADAPRVSIPWLEEQIDAVHYLNAETVCRRESPARGEMNENVRRALSCLTLCIITFKNGFTQVGQSAPASPENFDFDRGKQFAFENAMRQAQERAGWGLRDKLMAAAAGDRSAELELEANRWRNTASKLQEKLTAMRKQQRAQPAAATAGRKASPSPKGRR